MERAMDRLTIGRKGFTMIEALAASLITGTALTVMIYAMTQGLRGIRENDIALQARNACIRQMELLRNKTVAQLAGWEPNRALLDENGDGVADGLEETTDANVLTGRIYICSYDPSTGNCAAGSTSIKKVTVTISWNNVSGSPRSWRLVSLITDPS